MIRSGQAVGRIKGGAGGTEVKHFILARTAARLKEEPVTVLAWFLQRSNTFFFLGAILTVLKSRRLINKVWI